MKEHDFDRFLSENCVNPTFAIMNTNLWNGYWFVKRTNRFFRWIGRKLKNKYVYWLGFQVVWVSGLKEYQHFVDWNVSDSDGYTVSIEKEK